MTVSQMPRVALADRPRLLLGVALLLQGCPALLDDDFTAVDARGGSGGEAPTGGTGGAGGGVAAAPSGGGDVETGGQVGTGGDLTGGTAGTGTDTGGTGAVGNSGTAGLGWAATSGRGGTVTGGIGGTGGVGGSGGAAGVTSGAGGSGGTAGSIGGEGGLTGGSAGVNAGAGGDTGGEGGSAGSGATGGVQCTSSPTDCAVLRSALLHRYRFEGTGTMVVDSVSGADGIVIGGAELNGDGQLELAGGGSGEFVDLPNRIISDLYDSTIEAWVIWDGGLAWQRMFDFGDAVAGECLPGADPGPEGEPGSCGRTYLNLTPNASVSGDDIVRSVFQQNPGSAATDDLRVDGPPATVGSEMHVAVVVDDTNDLMLLYVDGTQAGSEAFDHHLSEINDINNWLGRSQFEGDATRGFAGAYLEFRVYAAALTESQVATSFAEGPDPAFLD